MLCQERGENIETEITIEKAEWSKLNHDYNAVIVKFFYPKLETKTYIEETSPRLKGRVFKWLPTYKQLEEIRQKLMEVEILNANRGTNGSSISSS